MDYNATLFLPTELSLRGIDIVLPKYETKYVTIVKYNRLITHISFPRHSYNRSNTFYYFYALK